MDEARPTLRERRRAERRRSIVGTALGIVTDAGLDSLTMPKLANELGVAVGGLYRYFSSKDRLVVELQLASLDAYRQYLEHRLDSLQRCDATNPKVPGLCPLVVVTRSWVGYRAQAPRRSALVEALWYQRPGSGDEVLQQDITHRTDRVFNAWGTVLKEAVEQGSLADGSTETRVRVLWGAIFGAALLRPNAWEPDHEAEIRYADEVGASVLAGWGADPAALNEAQSCITYSHKLADL